MWWKKNNLSRRLLALYLVIAMGILIFVLWKNYAPLGQQTIIYNFGVENKLTTGFYPSTRFDVRIDNGQYISIFADPIYLDLRTARRFRTATVTAHYASPSGATWNLGVKNGPGWTYYNQKVAPSGTTWETATVSFDLSSSYEKSNFLSFIISGPSIKGAGKRLNIDQLTIELHGDNLAQKIYNYVKN